MEANEGRDLRDRGNVKSRNKNCGKLKKAASKETAKGSRLPGSFRRRGFQPDLLMPQEALFARGAHSMQAAMRRALLRRGRSGNAAFSKTESNVAGNLCRMCRKEESRHGDFSLHNQNRCYGMEQSKNCELWRSEWAKVCNEHLPLHNQVDHRSYEKQGKLQIPTIHEGADARKD